MPKTMKTLKLAEINKKVGDEYLLGKEVEL